MKTPVTFWLLLLFGGFVTAQNNLENQKQFDFWIGEWDVNVRVHQQDLSWRDQHQSTARIYSILKGKAILELWSENEDGINGYSLRYFNPNKDKWDLWLNWAGKNRSGTRGMECTFRHGRGECFSERQINDTTNLLSRYTFSDISANKVRWDDAFSRDGGKTWSNNWIMEFTRKAKIAPAIKQKKNLLTYFSGNRCDLAEFKILKDVSDKRENNSNLHLHNILDGCIVIGFIDTEEQQAFFTLTYNTYASVYELTFLDDQFDSVLSLYYGQHKENGFMFRSANGDQQASLIIGDNKMSLTLDYHNKKQAFNF